MTILCRLFFTLTTLLLPLIGEARIIETANVADAIQFIDEDTWFLVDLDITMFEGKQALGHTEWFYDKAYQKMKNGMTLMKQLVSATQNGLKCKKHAL